MSAVTLLGTPGEIYVYGTQVRKIDFFPKDKKCQIVLLSVRPIGRLLPLRDGGHSTHVHACVLRPERVHELRGDYLNANFEFS